MYLDLNGGEDAGEIQLLQSLGPGRLFSCCRPTGEQGIIALQPNGHWWWIQSPDDPRPETEPPEPWRG